MAKINILPVKESLIGNPGKTMIFLQSEKKIQWTDLTNPESPCFCVELEAALDEGMASAK